MSSSVLHFRFSKSSSWAHIPIYCLYELFSNTNDIFGGVSIHDPLGSFPLLIEESSTDDS
jgi:hypothetical protein